MACVIRGCKSHASRNTSRDESEGRPLTFHRFPSDAVRYNEWMTLISRHNDRTPKNNRRICSKHFTSDSFYSMKGFKRTYLRDNAVPTIFIENSTDEKDPIKLEICEIEPGISEPGQDALSLCQDTTRLHSQDVKLEEGNSDTKPITSIQISKPGQALTPSRVASPLHSQKKLPVRNSEIMYQKEIKMLKNQLIRCKNTSYRRLIKIKTLRKRIDRLEKKLNIFIAHFNLNIENNEID